MGHKEHGRHGVYDAELGRDVTRDTADLNEAALAGAGLSISGMTWPDLMQYIQCINNNRGHSDACRLCCDTVQETNHGTCQGARDRMLVVQCDPLREVDPAAYDRCTRAAKLRYEACEIANNWGHAVCVYECSGIWM
jgi:hypothetical protein